MTLEQALAKMNELQAAQQAYNHAMGVLSLDGDTAAPSASAKGRAETMGYLSGVTYRLLVNDEVKEALETILSERSRVTPMQARQAELLKEDYDDSVRIPMDEYIAFSTLVTQSNAVWHEAKLKSDYAAFAPYLEKIIDFNRRFAGYKDATKPAYDVLLDGFEKGTTTEALDPFFSLLREKLTPVILEVASRPEPDTSFFQQRFPLHDQRLFSDKLMALMGLPRDRCGIAETEHPFTTNFNKWDVRITTHYAENDVADSMYSVIHEGGHALYELGTADEIQFTNLASGATMGLHESQSRFYENLIGRSLPFCRALLPLMQECFPQQMQGVTAEQLYAAVNKARPSLIRTQADELTYGMHIAIRYEMEKLMISGDAKVSELPAIWNRMYKDYLGVTVPSDREGILQDVHWAGGQLGYFPSYALGSAYGVQMLSAMEKEFDPWADVEKGDLSRVTAWLGEKIHRYGKLLTPSALLQNAIGQPFDPNFYVEYLQKKFSALYRL
ncbi:MAG: carboxypeptidase M32 [Clostridiales bacterium]|nr:carboxypeptidase M32 [Clostridiales bacterium]